MGKQWLVCAWLLVLSGCTFNYRESYLVSPQPDLPPALDALRDAFPGHGFMEGRIEVDGASLYTLAMTRPDAQATVLYFGGNGYRTGRSARFSADVYAALPVNLVLVDHRGYGTSTGSPGIDALMDDALRVHDHVAGDPSRVGLPLIVHGQSLGSFMAGHVAARRALGGLVLESSATTTEDWVAYQRSRLPWWQRMWIRRIAVEGSLAQQGNLPVAAGLDEPVLYVVGKEDLATPPDFTRRLYDATPLPETCRALLVVPGRDHNNATRSDDFRAEMTRFVGRVAAAEAGAACRSGAAHPVVASTRTSDVAPRVGADRIEAAHAQLEAIDADRGRSRRERIGMLEAAYSKLLQPHLSGGVAALAEVDLFHAFDAAYLVAFYTSSEAPLRDMHALLAELERRNAATDEQRQRLFLMLMQYREFDQARAFTERHPGMEVEPVPEVLPGARGAARGPLVYRPDPERFALRQERAAFDQGMQVLMVTHPLCAFSRAAMEAIAADPALSAALADDTIWLAPADSRLRLDAVQAWNRDHPAQEIVFAHRRSDWPMLRDGWATPEFYVLREGQVVDHFAGWPRGDGNRARLVELLVRAGRMQE